ncbi:hypothetical protein WR25_18455 isoform A [Diploscapter pachys]|uniref:PUM-HD domain-containing protein n=1 Tax=Diploscapter pachys TaxID=2018661 RepID=A0A2A2K2F8_9BILA|nr:hypothetical protein WR25_18455 isoform A [Diploscapter pachys]
MASMGLSDRSSDSRGNSSSGGQSQLSPAAITRTTLPTWVFDDAGNITATLSDVILRGQLVTFASDKTGCHYLQEKYPKIGTSERTAMIEQILANPTNFDQLCGDVFANFFLQHMISQAAKDACEREMQLFVDSLKRDIGNRALSRYSCRVLQKAIECLDSSLTIDLLVELTKTNLVPLCVDQNANHVIQKMVAVFPSTSWCRLVERLLSDTQQVIIISENKYGCRVIQMFIEQMCARAAKHDTLCSSLLRDLMSVIMSNCTRMASNEFANYVVQHIIQTPPLAEYRDAIIDQCLLKNLLSMSQEKYASHVVEAAFENAPPVLLKEMMEEIFDGYVPHPDTKKDALDILMFHQYGNYVVQRMLNLCCMAFRVKLSGMQLPDHADKMEWLRRLQRRILDNESRLTRYSSGKKIIDTLRALPAGGATNSPVSMSSSTSPSASACFSPFFKQNLPSHLFSPSSLSSPRALSTSSPPNSASLTSDTVNSLMLPPIHGFHHHSAHSPMGSYTISHGYSNRQQNRRPALAQIM